MTNEATNETEGASFEECIRYIMLKRQYAGLQSKTKVVEHTIEMRNGSAIHKVRVESI